MPFKVKDFYYHKAKKEKYLARSIYKLEEIDQRYKIIHSGDSVLDLGYYPGSWIQYSSNVVGKKGQVVGVDLADISKKICSLKNVRLYKRDAFELQYLSEIAMDQPFDIVLSDMAPKTSGIKSLDQIRSLNLVEKIFHLIPSFLRTGGSLVFKVFDGQEAQDFLQQQKKYFQDWHYLKPRSTRQVSKEFFVIGKGFKA
jgi:23S rRNA (uridine2552-2'-O)-methyltransferase